MASDNTLNYVFKGSGLTVKERNTAQVQFENYRANYSQINKLSDLLILEDLIFHEVIAERLKEGINDLFKKNKKAGLPDSGIPANFQKALSDNLDLQVKLKDRLGFFIDQKQSDVYTVLRDWQEDFAEYRRKNPDLFKTTCPQCGLEYFLKRKTLDYEACGTEWFRDKVLCNPVLWKKFKSNTPITANDLAEILGVSVDQIDWLDKNIFNGNKEVTPDPDQISTDKSSDISE